MEKSPSVNYGDTFGKIAKYKLWGHIWIDRRRRRRRNAQILNAKKAKIVKQKMV